MKTRELLVKTAELFLESDEATKEWANVTELRRGFYIEIVGSFLRAGCKIKGR